MVKYACIYAIHPSSFTASPMNRCGGGALPALMSSLFLGSGPGGGDADVVRLDGGGGIIGGTAAGVVKMYPPGTGACTACSNCWAVVEAWGLTARGEWCGMPFRRRQSLM